MSVFLKTKKIVCRLGSCSQPMDKQLPSPSTVWIFLHLNPAIGIGLDAMDVLRLGLGTATVTETAGWRSMMGPPHSASLALGLRVVTITHNTTSVPTVFVPLIPILLPPSPAPLQAQPSPSSYTHTLSQIPSSCHPCCL